MAENPQFSDVLRIKAFTSASLSTDGSWALFMGERDGGGGSAGFMVPAELLEDMRAHAFALKQQAERRGVGKAWVVTHIPQEFVVADSDQYRGCALVILDPNTVKEIAMAFADQAAMKLAQLLTLNVRKRHKSIIIPAG